MFRIVSSAFPFTRIHYITLAIAAMQRRKFSYKLQGGSNMTGTDLCVNKPHCAAAVRP